MFITQRLQYNSKIIQACLLPNRYYNTSESITFYIIYTHSPRLYSSLLKPLSMVSYTRCEAEVCVGLKGLPGRLKKDSFLEHHKRYCMEEYGRLVPLEYRGCNGSSYPIIQLDVTSLCLECMHKKRIKHG